MDLTIHPIGIYHSDAKYPYDVARQGVIADSVGRIELLPGHNFEAALDELDGFSHVWLIFWFHLNNNWNPKIRPPRHRDSKVGVFASRSPHRPNPLGLSAVRLVKVKGLNIHVADCDLLDGTPIFDIKPYLPYADAFPDAAPGWTGQDEGQKFNVVFSKTADEQIDWLSANGVPRLRQFVLDRLEFDPFNPSRNRLVAIKADSAVLAYRTWRIDFSKLDNETISVNRISSGYSQNDFLGDDKYGDFDLHRKFLER